MIIAKTKSEKLIAEMQLVGSENIKPIVAGQPVEVGGTGDEFRPGQLLLAGFAGCIQLTARKMLNKEGLKYDDVIVTVDMDNSEEGVTKFFRKIEIVSDTISEDKKKEIIEILKDCPVCNILSNKKEFLDL